MAAPVGCYGGQGHHTVFIGKQEGEMVQETAERAAFDPNKYMRTIRTKQGEKPYLDAKARILWLRHEHPDAQIMTEQVDGGLAHDMVAFKATITFLANFVIGRDGGIDYIVPSSTHLVIGTGHGSETKGDFPDFYEKAETKAIARACAVLGFGTENAVDLDDGEPMDGLPAAKDERAARATPRDTAPREVRPASTPVQAPRQISATRSQGERTVTDTAWLAKKLNNELGWNIGEGTKLGDIITVLQEEYEAEIPTVEDKEGKPARFPSGIWAWVQEQEQARQAAKA